MPPKLDDKDIKIIKILTNDGRMPASSMPKGLGISNSTIIRKLNRLKREKVVEIYAQVNYQVLGYRYYSIEITFEQGSENINSHLEAMADLPKVHSVYRLIGSIDARMNIYVKSTEELEEFIDKYIKSSKVIRNFVVNEVIYSPLRLGHFENGKGKLLI